MADTPVTDRRRSNDRREPEVPEELRHLLSNLPAPNRRAAELMFATLRTYALSNAAAVAEIKRVLKKIIVILAVALLLIVGVMAATGILTIVFVGENNQTFQRVQQGRQVSLGVTCATLSSVAEAGRVTIEGSPKPPPQREERALEALGFPSFAKRHKQAIAQGAQYVKSISQAVDRQIGRKGDGLVRPDGTINCNRLAHLAQLNGYNHANLATGRTSQRGRNTK